MSTNFSSEVRNYYLRMPRELHDKVLISSLLNRRTLKDEIITALTEYVGKKEEQIEEAKKEVIS